MAGKVSDGGPAFPVELSHHDDGSASGVQTGPRTGWCKGMALRDYFATAALQGIVGNSYIAEQMRGMKAGAMREGITAEQFEGDLEFPAYSSAAYRIADAMLKARERKAGE